MDKDAIIGILNKETGRAGDLAKAIIAYKNAGWPNREQYQAALEALLLEGDPADLAAIFANGPRRLFEVVHGKKVAALAAKVVGRMNRYVHSPSTYRRSFRSADPAPYLDRLHDFLTDLLFYNWEHFDLVKTLSATNDFPYFEGDFIALAIDEGEAAVIRAIKDICLGDNNTRLLSDSIINGIIKSENAELHKLLGDMLLAAKLQEGLRQSILENADNGRVEVLIYLMKLVIDHDLIRYSSALRAVDVWMGMAEGYDDKRVATKLLNLGYAYLTDKKARTAALVSKDGIEIYAALWALSVREMADVQKPLEKLLKGEKYQKLIGLYFLNGTENKGLQFAVSSAIVADRNATDLDILSLALAHPFDKHIPWSEEDFASSCQNNRFLRDKKTRDEQFTGLLRILPLVSQRDYSVKGQPFPWCSLSLSTQDICPRLLKIAGYDFDREKIRQLIDVMPQFDYYSRSSFIKLFLKKPANQAERDFVFASLNDKSMPVRSRALENVLGFSTAPGANTSASASALGADEEKLVIDLLSLKTGDIRQNSVKILLALPGDRPKEAAKKLLADKNENKRLAGLDMLTQLVNTGALQRTDTAEYIALMPKTSDREQVLINALTAEAPRFNKANGFGLYDPDYRPEFPPFKSDPRYTLEAVFGVSRKRMEAIFDSLCALIKENRDYTYQIDSYDDGIQDVKLGGLEWPRVRAEVQKNEGTAFDGFVLQEVWRGWMQKNALTFAELFYCMFANEVSDYNDEYEPDYADWAKALVNKLFHAKEVDAFIRWKRKKEYSALASHLLDIFWTEFPEEERFAMLFGLLADVMGTLKEADWKRPIAEDRQSSVHQTDDGAIVINDPDDLDAALDLVEKTESRAELKEGDDNFLYTEEVIFILRSLKKAMKDDGRFSVVTALCFELGRLEGMYYRELDAPEIARGVALGLLKKDALTHTMFLADYRNMAYAGKIRWESCRKEVEEYPLLKTCADEAAARVIEIELDRGDSDTEVSRLAAFIHWHEGAETFVKILTALGNENFVRGYCNGSSRKSVLSSLLKASHPTDKDSAETLRTALVGKNISEKRLIEAAMYAPAWLDIVGDTIGWPGLKSAAWYFHAHINENFSAEKETEVARYSPVNPEEFNDGAFDIAWFRDALNTLGAERFDIVYDCAKYLTEGSNHRRAQLFADAVQGRLDKESLATEIHDKRNKDKLLSYSLIPLAAEGAAHDEIMTEALKRYEFIQQFLKESKSFGAQRRESEAKACAIAQDNLARNAGFSDAPRFAWRMETLKIAEVRSYFAPVDRSGYQVHVEIADNGGAALICEKDGKKLSSVPAALKKDEYVTECKDVVSSLKQQFKRARASLEQAMINRDPFACGEIKTLMEHPVVAPLLAKLVFVSVDEKGAPKKSGVFCEFSGLKDNTPLRIAHPYDLFTLGTWLDCQRYAFEHKLVQPFKQIFRELYLVNEDEKREKTISRRYAGHQVQPKKTVALLKGRGWTVDYEEGLQRVYYRENFYATVYAAADWFSPGDTEAPTLETVRFFPRRVSPTGEFKPLELANIPPVIFSEVMRDIDLVVSVAHVGGVDPEASHSTVEMRAAIVRELLALLHVENVTVEARHAKIKGRLGEYTVHLGSGQVHLMGRGALNILAIPSQHWGRVFLPFADDDFRTAEVMSKILMLADDKTIKDPAILFQVSACAGKR